MSSSTATNQEFTPPVFDDKALCRCKRVGV